MIELEYGKTTLELIQGLIDQGINKISIIMRHSARHYDWKHPETEPFMMLTEEGKEYAFNLGKALPPGLTLRLYSSHIGRCIETAYLIDKGYVFQNGKTVHNKPADHLAPSYVKKPFELVKIMQENYPDFVRFWFNENISTDIIDPPQKAAQTIIQMLSSQLDNLPDNHINIGVSHDWNLYLVKEQIMGLKHEEVGKVDYLEGVALYQNEGQTYIANHQCKAIPLPLQVNIN